MPYGTVGHRTVPQECSCPVLIKLVCALLSASWIRLQEASGPQAQAGAGGAQRPRPTPAWPSITARGATGTRALAAGLRHGPGPLSRQPERLATLVLISSLALLLFWILVCWAEQQRWQRRLQSNPNRAPRLLIDPTRPPTAVLHRSHRFGRPAPSTIVKQYHDALHTT